MSGPVEPVNGWHWGTWAAEFGCTAVLMFAVVSAKTAAVTAGAPYSSPRGQNLVIGVTAGLAVMTLAFTPWGRRSGPHLNPAVTLGLWRMRVVSSADLAGYWVAQLAGAMTGVAASRVWGSRVSGPQIDWAVTAPGESVGSVEAAAIEAAATFVQLLILFVFLRSRRLSAWTAPVAGGVLTVAIVALGSVSGAAFNPVRGLAFDIVANRYPAVWVFVVGPLLAAVLAPMAVPRWFLLTGKLRHDGRYRCWMRCAIPHVELPGERHGEDVRSTVLSDRDGDSTSPARQPRLMP